MEYAVPLAALSPTLRALRQALGRGPQPLHLPLDIRFMASDGLLLGTPASDGHAAVLSVAAPTQLPAEVTGPQFREAEAVLRAHGGRPQWGKLHALGEAELAPSTPVGPGFRRPATRLTRSGALVAPTCDGCWANKALRLRVR
ncbi:D-arabinono-1,4-lactone oxidase [Deinococcus lacus]|uniref:D-arabinono-1,4-lactone oxidase n=1 Tax=Deinococcus lacus TaxID=392561 RepID=A0ABW1YCQ7_9DEIO